jgi:hypothetical protein
MNVTPEPERDAGDRLPAPEATPARQATPPPRVSLALWLGLFGAGLCFFMLTSSRERPWADATPIFDVAERIVVDHTVATNVRWPPTLPPGADGRFYAVSPLLPSLVHVPGAFVRQWLTEVWPPAGPLLWPLASHLAPSALMALTMLLFLRLCLDQGASLRSAGVVTAALALATTVWVYARYPYSEALQTFAFTGFFGRLLRTHARPTWRSALLLGVWSGLLINAKLVFVVALPGAFVFAAWPSRRDLRALGRLAGLGLVGLLPLLAIIFAYNKVRWGSAFSSGYDTSGKVFGETPWAGFWGLFLSPNKSVFVYSPPLLLTLLYGPRLLGRWRQGVRAAAATLAPIVAVYCFFLFWAGDYAWGPRYLVFAVPVLLVPAAFLLDDVRSWARPWARRAAHAGVALVIALGFLVQVLGNAFYWDHYIRIARVAMVGWLGMPNRDGAAMTGVPGNCHACFEDMYAVQWLPPFHPIDGHWWLLRHVPFKHTWQDAEKDAPWHRHTSLPAVLGEWYDRARIDWWYLSFAGEKKVRAAILAGMSSAFLLSIALLLFGIRRTRARAGPL